MQNLKTKPPHNPIAQNPPLITCISTMVCTSSLIDAIQDIKDEMGDIFTFRLYLVNDLASSDFTHAQILKLVEQTQILLFDIRGNNPFVEELVAICHELERDDLDFYQTKTIISLVGGNAELRELTQMGSFKASRIPSSSSQSLGFDEIPDLTNMVKKGIKISQNLSRLGKLLPFGMMRHLRNWTQAMDYWVYGYSGVPENHKNLILFLLKEYLGYKTIKVPEPLKIPPFGIFDPRYNQYYSTLNAYLEKYPLDPKKQTIGLFFYGGIYFEQTLPILQSFMDQLSDFNLLPVYAEVLHNLDAIRTFFYPNNQSLVGLVINLQYFQLNGGPFGGNNTETLNLYTQLNVPQFNPVINFDMDVEEYLESQQGILPINQVIAVIMPELDGRIEMMNVGCMETLGFASEIESQVYDITPLEDNIRFISARIRKWMRLRSKPNADKKIAIILYDYPPGESSLGNASYLDCFTSLEHILNILHKENYNVSSIPPAAQLIELFLNSGIINNPEHISLNHFQGVSISQSQYYQLISEIPYEKRVEIETVWGGFPGKIMTQNNHLMLPILEFGNISICLQPPRSQISDVSQEYHNKALVPHHQYLAFYRYLDKVVDVDAIIHVGTHGTVEFLPGKENVGYWKDYNHLFLGESPNIYLYHVSNTSEAAIAKRRSNAVIINHSPPPIKISGIYEEYERLETILQEYQEIVSQQSHVDKELITEYQLQIEKIAEECNIPYTSFHELESCIYRMKLAAIPAGLHTFGHNFTSDQAIEMILDILLHSSAIPSDLKEFVSFLTKRVKLDPQEGIRLISEFFIHKGLIPEEMEELHHKSTRFISDKDSIPQLTKESEAWLISLYTTISSNTEMKNLILALEGGYILPGFGGDPIRSPNIFPTGRNSFGFDPRLIPSASAYHRGEKIAHTLLEQEFQAKGKYPETVSVVLWAFETMKTGGETIGQIFNYLGIRAVKHKSVWTTELEVIPLEELNHPRINVVITICGIFRDTFPYLVDLINQAVEMIGTLEESHEQNYVLKTRHNLEGQKVPHPLARIFGPSPGKYNTNLTEIIGKGEWKDEEELAKDYIQNMGHAYLPHQQIVSSHDTFKENLRQITYLSQVRDGAEYHITDLDHYYEFSGGLIKAAESVSGTKPALYIADTTDVEIIVNSVEKAIQESVVTRNLNPKWINGMLQHKHHGTQKVAERMENLLGFTATTHQVDNWVWEKSYQKYVEDEQIKNQLIENNRFAMMKMIKTMLEAEQRGYWETDQDHIDTLKELYLDLEGWVENAYQ